MNWCEEQGLIERSPLAHFKKPRGGKRDKVISADEYAAIRQQIRNDDFRDLVMFIWETGARAAECLAIEPRHVDHTNSRIVFPVSEENMERAPRIIYLNAAARGMLMGHAAPSMVARVYSHLNHAPDYLLKAVERAGRKASAM